MEGLNVLFRVICYVCTLFIVLSLFNQYYQNKDTSVVVIKSFGTVERTSFPSVTLFLKSDITDALYNNQYIMSIAGMQGKEYANMLLGNVNSLNISALESVNFEMAIFPISKFLTRFRVLDTNKNSVIDWKNNNDIEKMHAQVDNLPITRYYLSLIHI